LYYYRVLHISLYMVESKRHFNSICNLNHEGVFIQRVNRITVVWNVKIYSFADRCQRFVVTWLILSQLFCIEAGGGKFRRHSTCLLKDRVSHPRQHNFVLANILTLHFKPEKYKGKAVPLQVLAGH
jgi:hypothetical protein